MSARDDLRELRERVDLARQAVAAAERERGRAPRRYEQARAALREHHAAVAAGAPENLEHERELAGDLARVIAEISTSDAGGPNAAWRDESAEARLADAQHALEDAERDVDAFLWTRSEDVAAELAAHARDVAARYAPVAAQIECLESEFHATLAGWREILEPLGIAARDLPKSPASSSRFSMISPPMPTGLMRDDEMSPVARATWEARQAAERDAAERAQIAASLEQERARERAPVQ